MRKQEENDLTSEFTEILSGLPVEYLEKILLVLNFLAANKLDIEKYDFTYMGEKLASLDLEEFRSFLDTIAKP